MMLLWAQIAMGDGNALMREYSWRAKLGWHTSPEALLQIAEPHARKLIWC